MKIISKICRIPVLNFFLIFYKVCMIFQLQREIIFSSGMRYFSYQIYLWSFEDQEEVDLKVLPRVWHQIEWSDYLSEQNHKGWVPPGAVPCGSSPSHHGCRVTGTRVSITQSPYVSKPVSRLSWCKALAVWIVLVTTVQNQHSTTGFLRINRIPKHEQEREKKIRKWDCSA